MLDKILLDVLVCPKTKEPLVYDETKQLLIAKEAGLAYRVVDGVPVLLVEEAIKL
jgi:uncharacterized protein YbaR (Trm112 family)